MASTLVIFPIDALNIFLFIHNSGCSSEILTARIYDFRVLIITSGLLIWSSNSSYISCNSVLSQTN